MLAPGEFLTTPVREGATEAPAGREAVPPPAPAPAPVAEREKPESQSFLMILLRALGAIHT